jgi:zinc metalloprotease ZmpA
MPKLLIPHVSRRLGAAVAAIAAATTAVVALAGPVATAAPTAARGMSPSALRTRAAMSADALVSARPAGLHAGPADGFVRQPVLSSRGWQYVPYKRTYRGLPVVGGDFVVVIDPAGRVSSTSVAQRVAIKNVGTRPRLSRAAAGHIASRQLRATATIEGTRLVVYAAGARPRLAWEATVAGTGAHGYSILTVDVDAATGAVLRSREDVMDDDGHSALNGSVVQVDSVQITPVDANGNPVGGPAIFVLGVPAGGLSCDPSTVKRVDPQPLVWGDGDPTDPETACVDAVYATETEWSMLRNWAGGSGVNGGGFHISTDSSLIDNSYYVPSSVVSEPEVHIGRTPAGVWLSAIDIVAHENGHGIDDFTPGGISGNGTTEFIADAFGTATEWFANEQAPYDTPDFIEGDNPVVNLPASLFRHLYDPQLDGGQNCYDGTTATIEPHLAAGVGDHWFYLLSEGTNPTDGQPVSPTCNNTVFGGIGIRSAIQILYNAMLMKTSNSSYPAYRTWTLTAARNLFPGNCDVIAKVKAAWDAVGVPAQPGEPSVCVPGVTGLSQSDAMSAITSAGLALGNVSQQASLSPVGSVVAQNPSATTIEPLGFPVDITVSLGGVLVPNVLSDSAAEAESILSSAGLSFSVSSSKQCIDPGAVLNQNPRGGAVALRGSTVHLTVDSGTLKTCIIK